MDVKTLSELARRVRKLTDEQRDLVEALLEEEPLIVGSVSNVLRRCGNPNCHCARQPAHPSMHLATHRDGKRRCQLIRKADEALVDKKVSRYRHHREQLRRLADLESDRRALLTAVADARGEDYS